MNHHTHHVSWYRYPTTFYVVALVIGILTYAYKIIDKRIENKYKTVSAATALRRPICIDVKLRYTFYAKDGVYSKEIKNVGMTYYKREDGFTPGHTTRSGRFVYEGSIAVSQALWQKEVWPGDLIYVTATDTWYKVEDTMNSKYTEPRIDIYTEDSALATSGSSKTDILIVRQPK